MRRYGPLLSDLVRTLQHTDAARLNRLGDRSIAALLQSQPSADKSPREVQVNGYVNTLRRQKNIVFATIRDGSTVKLLQAAIRDLDLAAELSAGAAVRLTGEWRACPPGLKQTHELHVTKAQVLGENDATKSPLQKKYQSQQFLRTIPHLRPRLPLNALLLRLRSQVINSLTNYLTFNDFVQTHTPVITSSDCEGAGEVFTVSANGGEPAASHVDHYFKSPKFLTVSAQLHLEALAQSVGRVWTLSPTFRAEKSDTPRHLSEFYMLEAEMCFTEDMHQVMDVVEEMLRQVATDLQASSIGAELLGVTSDHGQGPGHAISVAPDVLRQRWSGLEETRWPRITYNEVLSVLKAAHSRDSSLFEAPPLYDEGLQAEHERYIANHMGNRGSPVFVTDYPQGQKPFYMAPSATRTSEGADTETVACFDLLVPDLCELVGGSMREHRSAELLASMHEHGLLKKETLDSDSENENEANKLQWYADLRRYGSVPHGGFGLGFDRLLCYLSGVSNLRDVVSFPRWYGRCQA